MFSYTLQIYVHSCIMCVYCICIISPKLKPPHTQHSRAFTEKLYCKLCIWCGVAGGGAAAAVVCGMCARVFQAFHICTNKGIARTRSHATNTHTHIQRIFIIIIYVSPSLRARMWTNTHIKYIFASVYKLIRIIFVYVCVNNNIILKCLRTYKIAHI